ncbi:endopeptidase La [Candidatus Dependentiae bacterium]|nr:endopeptidase La [Candidatus Dependentiae bacterium]
MDEQKKFLEEIPQILPVIPTIDVLVFPNMVVPLLVLDEKIINGIREALDGNKMVLLLAAKSQEDGYQGPIGVQDLYSIGTVATIMRAMDLPDGGIKVLTQGVVRARVGEIYPDQDILRATVSSIPFKKASQPPEVLESKIRKIAAMGERVSEAEGFLGADFQAILSQMEDPERMITFILSHVNLRVDQAQNLLEKDTLDDLVDSAHECLGSHLEVAKVEEQIRTDTREQINKSQREYYLREQLRAIQKELGEEGDSELEAFKNNIDKMPLSDEAKTEASRQIRRLERTSPDSLEATVLRNHLEWLLAMPWGVETKEKIDIRKAKEILDNDHYGLNLVKDRILDYLSVMSLKEDCHAPILCLAGPPGVGKTSLGRSIARSMGRNFARLSLGGVHDESEIRGHRRTYVGALPGRFVQAIRRAGSSNPLIMIDEIDKIGASGKGDPSSALLEVLDPEQNGSFYDNYLGVHFDLSKVMFVATANNLMMIPGPLRDRMEIIQLAGYTYEEKLEIAKRHLVEKSIDSSGLGDRGVSFPDEVISELIHGYTHESGVRDLERHVQKLCSKYARALLEDERNVSFTLENLPNFLGARLNPTDESNHEDKIGVTNGLAWTPVGGEVLQVEAVLMPGSGKLLLTGQLGDVMKESAQAAVTYARAHADEFGIDRKVFTDYDLHIHLPAGAIPKDGPSAGITLLSSIFSVLTSRPVNCDFAMTGELNLQGNVLPIGGLKEKILAAKQYGLNNILLPKQNKKDMIDLDGVEKGLKIHWVDHVDEVLNFVLLPNGKLA